MLVKRLSPGTKQAIVAIITKDTSLCEIVSFGPPLCALIVRAISISMQAIVIVIAYIRNIFIVLLFSLVQIAGFESAQSTSQMQCLTGLSHIQIVQNTLFQLVNLKDWCLYWLIMKGFAFHELAVRILIIYLKPKISFRYFVTGTVRIVNYSIQVAVTIKQDV